MVRFIENFDAVNGGGARKLNLADMGLGDLSMRIIVISLYIFFNAYLSKNKNKCHAKM